MDSEGVIWDYTWGFIDVIIGSWRSSVGFTRFYRVYRGYLKTAGVMQASDRGD